MPFGLQAGQLPKEERHEIAETFADSLGQATFDGQTMRLEFCATRMNEVTKQGEKPTGKRYVMARMVLTPEAAVELFNVCQQIVGALKNAGVVKEQPAGAPAAIAAPPKA
jgi:hypothetical protein